MDINKLQILARNGDASAQEELFALLTARFRLFVRQRIRVQADAEDVVQDALKSILEKYLQIDFQISFSAWAYQVLNNKMMTFLGTSSRRGEILGNRSLINGRDDLRSPSHDLERRLLGCLQKLNKRHQRHARILNLHHQGYSVEEICSRMGLSRTNLYTVLSRARTMLETCLEKGSIT